MSCRITYTWAKLITNGDSLTAWLEDGGCGCGCAAQIQDNNNLRGERSLSQSDVPQRAVVSYVLDLPVGKGKRFLGTLSGPANQLVGGWGINGITTVQSGFPLAISAASNPPSQFGFGSLRPNVDGPNNGINGSAQGRVNEWFNVDEFSQPDVHFGSSLRESDLCFSVSGLTQPTHRNGLGLAIQPINSRYKIIVAGLKRLPIITLYRSSRAHPWRQKPARLPT